MRLGNAFFLRLLISALVILLLAGMLQSRVAAHNSVDYYSEYSDFLRAIPDEISKALPDGVYSDSTDEQMNAVRDMTSFDYIKNYVSELLSGDIKSAVKMFFGVCALLVLSSAVSAWRKSIGGEGLAKSFDICSLSLNIALILSFQMSIIKAVSGFLSRLTLLTNGMLPLISLLYVSGGNVAEGSAGVGALSLFISFCENVCGKTLLPVVAICISFAVMSAFSPQINMCGLSNTVKKSYTFVLGLLMSIMALIMNLQTVLSAKADSLSQRAARYAVSSFIPVLGGAVGDSLRTVAAGVEYIRGMTGGLAIIIIVLLLLPTLIKLLLAKTSINLCAFFAGLLGLDAQGKLLGELSGVYGYMLAICSICSVFFIYALTLFVRCSALMG